MLRKPILYNKAIELRQNGFSYNEILECVPVAQSTISRWCHKIILTEEQKTRLINKKRNTPLIFNLQKRAKEIRKEAEEWADNRINEILKHNKEQLLLISGILLYWAEGTNNKYSLGFTNTSSDMIKMMMDFFRKILEVPENKFKLMVRIGSKGEVEKAKKYWLKTTELLKGNLRKPEILELTANSKSLEKHPYGICRIEIDNVFLNKKLMALIKEFIKNFAPVVQRIEPRIPKP